MSNNELISIIIPTYNRANCLLDALESIQNQSYSNFEIIVVDDGSTDNTKEIVEKLDNPSIKYTYQENKGPAAAKNTGLKTAKGNIIAFLDSDDLWPEDKLEKQLGILCKNKNYEIVMGGIKHKDLIAKSENEYKYIDETYNRNSLGSGLFYSSVFKKVGLFDESLIYWEDLDWVLKAAEAGIHIHKHKEITLIVRLHKSNMSRDIESGNKYLSLVLKNSLKRRRDLDSGSVKDITLWNWVADGN